MILAAAIKFHIDKTDKDVVLCGCRHSDIFAQIKDLGFKPKEGYEEIKQGFINHKGEFLNRKEAYLHAKEIGQICNKIIYEREQPSSFGYNMISEDLW